MSQISRAQNELERVLLEIGRLEAQLASLRDRASKLAHYLEIARGYAGDSRAGFVEDGAPSELRPRSGGKTRARRVKKKPREEASIIELRRNTPDPKG
jgi:hypothetical protein